MNWWLGMMKLTFDPEILHIHKTADRALHNPDLLEAYLKIECTVTFPGSLLECRENKSADFYRMSRRQEQKPSAYSLMPSSDYATSFFQSYNQESCAHCEFYPTDGWQVVTRNWIAFVGSLKSGLKEFPHSVWWLAVDLGLTTSSKRIQLKNM